MPNKCETCKNKGNCAIEWQTNDIREMYTVVIIITKCKSYKYRRTS